MVPAGQNDSYSSSSSGSVDEEFLKGPRVHDSFFQEQNITKRGSTFSVILNETYLSEDKDEGKDQSTNASESKNVSHVQDNHPKTETKARRNLANYRNSKLLRLSHNSSESGSTNSTPLINTAQSDKCSSSDTSRETVNTGALLDSARQLNDTPLVHSSRVDSLEWSPSSHSGNDFFKSENSKDRTDNTKRSSQRTVSTSFLVSDRGLDGLIAEENENETSIPHNRTSSFYPPANVEDSFERTTDFIEDYEYDDTKPAIEEAVKLFKMEARRANMLELSNSENKNVHKRHASLLSSILIAPQETAQVPLITIKQGKKPMIPALRKVSGSSTPITRQGRFQSPNEAITNASLNNSLEEKFEVVAKPPSVYDNEMDTIDYLLASRKRLNQFHDLESNIPVQRVDIVSVSSQESKLSFWSNFANLFSISRLALLFAICLVIPPLFFFVGFGDHAGFNDQRLMKFLVQREHRQDLMPGFTWAIDLTSIRRIFIMFGLAELILLFACIGIGFGVGLTR